MVGHVSGGKAGPMTAVDKTPPTIIKWCETHLEPLRSFDTPTDIFGEEREACSVGMCDGVACQVVRLLAIELREEGL